MGLLCNVDNTMPTEVVTHSPVVARHGYVSPVHSPVIVKTVAPTMVPRPVPVYSHAVAPAPIYTGGLRTSGGVVYSPGGSHVLRTSGHGVVVV